MTKQEMNTYLKLAGTLIAIGVTMSISAPLFSMLWMPFLIVAGVFLAYHLSVWTKQYERAEVYIETTVREKNEND